ncbi:hypothetical protein FRX31_030847 [Thalictrum thalictroides]|uniref:Uncharacterized protein n=1 Tax=Thalictrum thalictroides TaxID=46969 RepID=A0A7J6V5W6_THATH|nr:hypothetical protein FRX31_030847 [Thalictrum thalictroides]
MQSKLNGRQEVKKQTTSSQHHSQVLHEQRKEEFSDWPHGLLAIGTFGNSTDIKEEKSQKCNIQNNQTSSEENQLDFTPEEVGKLQKELTKLLSRKPKKSSECQLTEDGLSLPLDKFLNCPSSLEVDRTNCNTFREDLDEKDIEEIASTIVLSNGKDMCMDKNKSIRKKSITFLLKKMFVCHSGFGPSPSLSDPIPESRMEKILRTLLHKKIYPQRPSTASVKKYLGDRPNSNSTKDDDQIEERRDSGAKWVKTDSECKFLYISLDISKHLPIYARIDENNFNL